MDTMMMMDTRYARAMASTRPNVWSNLPAANGTTTSAGSSAAAATPTAMTTVQVTTTTGMSLLAPFTTAMEMAGVVRTSIVTRVISTRQISAGNGAL